MADWIYVVFTRGDAGPFNYWWNDDPTPAWYPNATYPELISGPFNATGSYIASGWLLPHIPHTDGEADFSVTVVAPWNPAWNGLEAECWSPNTARDQLFVEVGIQFRQAAYDAVASAHLSSAPDQIILCVNNNYSDGMELYLACDEDADYNATPGFHTLWLWFWTWPDVWVETAIGTFAHADLFGSNTSWLDVPFSRGDAIPNAVTPYSWGWWEGGYPALYPELLVSYQVEMAGGYLQAYGGGEQYQSAFMLGVVSTPWDEAWEGIEAGTFSANAARDTLFAEVSTIFDADYKASHDRDPSKWMGSGVFVLGPGSTFSYTSGWALRLFFDTNRSKGVAVGTHSFFLQEYAADHDTDRFIASYTTAQLFDAAPHVFRVEWRSATVTSDLAAYMASYGEATFAADGEVAVTIDGLRRYTNKTLAFGLDLSMGQDFDDEAVATLALSRVGTYSWIEGGLVGPVVYVRAGLKVDSVGDLRTIRMEWRGSTVLCDFATYQAQFAYLYESDLAADGEIAVYVDGVELWSQTNLMFQINGGVGWADFAFDDGETGAYERAFAQIGQYSWVEVDPDISAYSWVRAGTVEAGGEWINIHKYLNVPINSADFVGGVATVYCELWAENGATIQARLWNVTDGVSCGESAIITSTTPVTADFSVTLAPGVKEYRAQVTSDTPGAGLFYTGAGIVRTQ